MSKKEIINSLVDYCLDDRWDYYFYQGQFDYTYYEDYIDTFYERLAWDTWSDEMYWDAKEYCKKWYPHISFTEIEDEIENRVLEGLELKLHDTINVYADKL